MNKDNLGSLPTDIHPLLTKLIGDLRTILDDREPVHPVWFMVDRRNERMIPIMAPCQDSEDHDNACEMVRTLVFEHQPHVDAVVFMCEAWKKNCTDDDEDFNDRTTPLIQREGTEECVMILVETYDGVWIADPVIKGKVGMKRELLDVEFSYQDGYDGSMASYLPARHKREVN